MISLSVSVKNITKLVFLNIIFAVIFVSPSFSEEKPTEGKFNPSEMIMHHIGDAYDWHFATLGGHHYTLPLPIIVYSPEKGLSVFSSSRLAAHGEHTPEFEGY